MGKEKSKLTRVEEIDLDPKAIESLERLSSHFTKKFPTTEWTRKKTLSFLVLSVIEKAELQIKAEESLGNKSSLIALEDDVLDALVSLGIRLDYGDVSSTIRHIMRSNSLI